MSCRATSLVLPFLFVLAGEHASGQTSAPPAGAKTPPAADSAEDAEDPIPILPLPPRPPDDAARTKRLDELRAQNDAEIAAQVAYGHLDEFLAAVQKRPSNHSTVKWMKVSDGFVPALSLQRYEAWSTAAAGRPTIRALDVELPGHPMNVLVDVDRELRSRGVDFVLVTFPSRAQLYPELLVPALPAAGMRPFTLASRRFAAKLLDAGVEVVDLGPLFFEQRFGPNGDKTDLMFLRTNPHWTSRACELAARTVADLLLARGFARGPAQEGRDFVVDRIQQEYRTLSDDAPDNAGSEAIPVTRVRTAHGKHLDPEDDASPIAVMGDSFVRMHDGFESGFERQLYRFLGQKIDAIAPEAGGDGASREMLRRRSAEVAKKKIVVWLASEQIFRVGEHWTPFRLFE
jgi:hypothetical protein